VIAVFVQLRESLIRDDRVLRIALELVLVALFEVHAGSGNERIE
jgi:hypothetical protein